MSRRSSTTSLSSDESSDADMLDAEQATLLEPNGTSLLLRRTLPLPFLAALLPPTRVAAAPLLVPALRALFEAIAYLTLFLVCACFPSAPARIARWTGYGTTGYGEGTCGYCSAKGERSAARSSKSYGSEWVLCEDEHQADLGAQTVSSKQMSPRVGSPPSYRYHL